MTTSTQPEITLIKPAPAAPAAAAPPQLSPPDAQRAALSDLVTLATQCAATEENIDRELQIIQQQSAENFEKSTKTIQFRAASVAEQIKAKHEATLSEIAQGHAAGVQAIRKVEIPSRKRAEADTEQVNHLVAKKISEAAWLADSDLEVTLNTLALEERKLREEVNGHLNHLADQEKESIQRSITFGYQPTTDELAVASAPEIDAAVRNEATAKGRPDAQSEAANGAANEPPVGKASGSFADAATAVLSIPTQAKLVDPDPAGTFAARRLAVDQAAKQLRSLGTPRLFVGITPWLIVIMLAAVAAGATWYLGGMGQPDLQKLGMAIGATMLVTIGIGLALRSTSRKSVQLAFAQVSSSLANARHAGAAQLRIAAEEREKARGRANHKRDTEVRFATDKYTPGGANARKKLEAALAAITAQSAQARGEIDAAREAGLATAEEKNTRRQADFQNRLDLERENIRRQRDVQVATAQRQYDQARKALESRLRDGLKAIRAPIEASAKAGAQAPADWNSPEWTDWTPTKAFASAVRFGSLHVDLMKIARGGAESGDVRLALPPPFDLPSTLAFPSRASLLIQADREGRAEGIRTVQMAMSRLLVSLPPGRVRFTLLDPVGLGQNFAGFMHLADHDDQLVGGRIWTETEQIDQRLNNLTGHMETVIQKYLRNEFETIDDYNAQAGELAEPYRFLVIADFPAGFTDESLRRLSSVAASGARCGVYTIVLHDTRLSFPHGVTTLEDLSHNSVHLELRNADAGLRIEGRNEAGSSSAQSEIRNPKSEIATPQSQISNLKSQIVPLWRDEVFAQFPLKLDAPPSELALTRICDLVGRGAKEAARVEVSFDTIAPPAGKYWSLDSAADIHVPIGRLGATRLQYMRLGKGVAQHVLIAGKTGSGKSTLLHTLVTNLALWYSPLQVEFYLVDFKKGVEFKTYASHGLPHARAIAVESDREFGLSVLQRLDAELTRRGELFRAAGVQDLAAYRRSPEPLQIPRTLLIIDEFQEFFSEDDKLAQDSSVLLDRLVRQGRAFGIHCLLGSQTIAGASGLPRSTIGQMAVRVALQTSEADSQLILGDNNSAARLLSRPGEAIYNDQGGLVEGNSPFQIAWLPDERKDRFLEQVRAKADEAEVQMPDAIVFEGNAPADLSKNRRLAALMERREVAEGPPRAWVGEPVAIKDATAIALRRQSGANILLIGQQEESAMATVAAALLSLATQVKPGTQGDAAAPRFYVFDATPADSSLAGTMAKLKDVIPHDVRMVDWRATGEAINEIALEATRRREEQDLGAAPIFLFISGLQRYRVLRKAEDEFGGFSLGGSGDEPKPADTGKQFAEILKEGPPVGIHTIAWADTATAVDRTLDRGSMREFDNRILFQMSANDSSNLIDSAAANRLGFHRALAYSEEQGVMEKFRPYGLPGDEFLARVKTLLCSS